MEKKVKKDSIIVVLAVRSLTMYWQFESIGRSEIKQPN